MKGKFTILLLTIILASCNATRKAASTETFPYFKVEVEQRGEIVSPKNGVITLEKAPFKYQLTLSKTDNVYVSNSWGKHYYDYPAESDIFYCEETMTFSECRFMPSKVGAEDKFNELKDIFVGNREYHTAWWYDKDEDWHRFDNSVVVEDGIIKASVTVEFIDDVDARDIYKKEESEYRFPIEKIDRDIYVVFAAGDYNTETRETKELQRQKFILKFK